MPAVVEGWVQQKDPKLCQQLQDEIIESYQIDFHKYAKQHQIPHVSKVFEMIPAMPAKVHLWACRFRVTK